VSILEVNKKYSIIHFRTFVNIHYLQHVPFEDCGIIKAWSASHGYSLSSTPVYQHTNFPSLDTIDLLVVLGGPMGADEEKQHPWLVPEKRFIEEAIKRGKKVMAICLGSQILARVLGAKVYANPQKEIGWFPVQMTPDAARSNLFMTLPKELMVFHWHGDTFDLPQGAKHIASSKACQHQAFTYNNERVVGLQFHCEITAPLLASMIQHEGEELIKAPFVQTASEINQQSSRINASNETMKTLLIHLTE
jgi:GMP synthase-like glutamine amidotransferase